MSLLDNLVHRCANVELLAEGGQKRVFAALHPDYGHVVIKHGECRYGTSLARVTREVEFLGTLASPYYPKHYELVIDPARREFVIIEERLDAVELTNLTHNFATDTQILRLLRHLIYALGVIWRQNVVHRDIKPANILITSDGEPRIIDLGIARFLNDKSLTATIAASGPATPLYAAPEQLANRKPLINVRTDFFLLDIVVLELLHGFHPFDPIHVGNDHSLVENIMTCTYVPPSATRDDLLITFVQRVLRPQPFQRFRTVDALMTHFRMERQSC
jgi:eukaryotic-like serine/threonine-protein kinase